MRNGIDRLLGRPAAVLILFLLSLAVGWRGFDLAWAAISRTPFQWRFSVNLRTTQYFFSYQDLGFVKRGLVGTLLHPFPALTTRVGIAVLSWVLLAAFAVQFWAFFIGATAAVAGQGRGVLALLCAATPAFFLRLGNDFGRFDVIDLGAALMCFALAARSRWFLASLPAALAILVHEDFILFALPMVVALAWEVPRDSEVAVDLRATDVRPATWLSRARRSRATLGKATLRLLALPAAAALAVGIWGRSRLNLQDLTDTFARNPAYRAALPDGQLPLNEISVLTRSLRDNFIFNRQMFVEKRALIHLPIVLAWFWFAARYAANFYRRNGLSKDGLFYAAFAPLLLGVVGFDYYRWVAMAAVNLILVVLLQCRRRAESGAAPVIDWDVNAKVLAASAILGPIGNTKSFLYLFLLLQKVSPWPISW